MDDEVDAEEAHGAAPQLWFYVDRIEGDRAVLVEERAGTPAEDVPDRDMPRALLPPGTRSGHWLKLRPGAAVPDSQGPAAPGAAAAGGDAAGEGRLRRRGRSPFVRDEEKERASIEEARALRKRLPKGYLPPA